MWTRQRLESSKKGAVAKKGKPNQIIRTPFATISPEMAPSEPATRGDKKHPKRLQEVDTWGALHGVPEG